MATFNLSNALPFRAIHPGEVIRNELEAIGMSQRQLAAATGIKTSVINEIIKGKRSLSPQNAVLIAEVLNIDGESLAIMQTRYEFHSEQCQKKAMERQKAISQMERLKQLVSIPLLKKLGVLVNDIQKNVEIILNIFDAKDTDDIAAAKDAHDLCFARKSAKVNEDKTDSFTWKSYCKFLSREDSNIYPTFDPNNKSLLRDELNAAFAENTHILTQSASILAKYGIRLIVVEKHGKVPFDGVSFNVAGVPTIALTLRHNRIDNLAFTIYHELGHIFLHIDKSENIPYSDGYINSKEEKEADNFASEMAMPTYLWKQFLNEWRASRKDISASCKSFGKANGINPAIILGRVKYATDNYRVKSDIPMTIG